MKTNSSTDDELVTEQDYSDLLPTDEEWEAMTTKLNRECPIKIRICKFLKYILPCFVCGYYIDMKEDCCLNDAMEIKAYGKFCHTDTSLCKLKEKLCRYLQYIVPCFICRKSISS